MLPMPGVVGEHNQVLPSSYTILYLAKGVVVAPVFNQKNDQEALSVLQKLLPDRKVVGVDCTNLVYGFGTIHCISQQQPSIKC
jgi:agmatine deiminase